MIVIVAGLIVISIYIGHEAGGAGIVIHHALEAEKFSNFIPGLDFLAIISFIGALVTMMLGSVPQQDVFQRVMSAKNEKTAMHGTIIGGSLYFVFAFIPVFIAYSAFVIDPVETGKIIAEDSQLVLPSLILSHTPLVIQVIFFGALLSAIMSTASGTLLAPSVMFSENILRPMLPHFKDKQFLMLTRSCVLGFAGIILTFALRSDLSIYEIVEQCYKVTLAGAFVPLAFGIYWKRANTAGATLSIIFGVSMWLGLEYIAPESVFPAHLAGLLIGIIGMVIGGYVGKQPSSALMSSP